MLTDEDRAALRAEDWPFCDLCGDPMDDSQNGELNDWNGETGNHLSCEEREAQRCQYESTEPGTLLCVLPRGHAGNHDTPRYAAQ